ncbi:phage regulatory Rha family protein, putative [Babesia ovata]|uniref:Phage regulatory Rha family protein, putative n=1 Tax=Babesia ovata TaxID=189622 RepID=A0A2H6KFF5_9APIC|nr:phage regulatory Rha family protein, putative [Babesia ovata]GBE61714.1 phage regulatory Rha family protein, putative [Babesia ovata]
MTKTYAGVGFIRHEATLADGDAYMPTTPSNYSLKLGSQTAFQHTPHRGCDQDGVPRPLYRLRRSGHLLLWRSVVVDERRQYSCAFLWLQSAENVLHDGFGERDFVARSEVCGDSALDRRPTVLVQELELLEHLHLRNHLIVCVQRLLFEVGADFLDFTLALLHARLHGIVLVLQVTVRALVFRQLVVYVALFEHDTVKLERRLLELLIEGKEFQLPGVYQFV